MSNTETASGGGIGLGTIIWIVLIVLKATGHLVGMSWFWVITSIIWAPISIFLIIIGIILFFAFIITIIKG